MSIIRRLALAAALGVLGVGAVLGALWLEHRTEVTLPAPSGPFAVGRTIEAWAGEAPDTLAPVPGARRELVVWIWYPADTTAATAAGEYLPAPHRAEVERARGRLMSGLLTRDLSRVHPHSLRNADVSPRQQAYPVVILRAGASAEVVNYSALAEDLASHGYVVVGFDAPYRTNVVVFPDGRVMKRTRENNPELCLGQVQMAQCADRLVSAWTADTAFVLDRLERLNATDALARFTGRLDLTRVGAVGHSFGGATVAQFCHEDSRCKAVVDLDGAPHGSVVQSGLQRPFMFLLSDHGEASDPESRQVWADIQSIYDRLPPGQRLRIVIRGANHFTFSDDGALLKSSIARRMLRLFGVLGIDGRRQLAVTSHCVHSFFDAYLKGSRTSRLDLSSPLYPEIQMLE